MSASITRVVSVTITKGTRTVSLAAFNVPVILGPSNRIGSDPYRVYSDPSDMLSDGFLISDPEYIHAVALDGQAIKPDRWLVSKFTAAVAQVDTFQVNTLTTGHAYAFTLNGTVITYTSSGGDTQQSVLSALLTAIGVAFPSSPPVSGSVTGTGSGATLTLTSTTAGVGVSYTAIDADLTYVNSVLNHSIVQDLVTLQGAVASTDKFYGVLLTSKIAADQLQMAAYIETQLLVYLASTSDSGILVSSSTTDIGSKFKNFAYTRSWLLYQATPANAGDAAWMGYMLPTTPGIGEWALKTLVGQTPDDQLSDTQINAAQAKNVNVYVTMGGQGTTLGGIAPSGDYMDEEIFDDWLASTMQTNVFSYLVDPANLKVPYLNKGITGIENQVAAALQQGQDNLGLAPGWSVFGPDAASVSSADKKARTLNGVGFTAERGGAITKVRINGFVTQ